MNESNTPESAQATEDPTTIKQPRAGSKIVHEPLPSGTSPFAVLEAVLKHPGRVFYELREGRCQAVVTSLLVLTVICLAVYGVVAGSLSGGEQLWAAPVKITLGMAAAALICLPSLYIFLCLAGIDLRVKEVAGGLLTMVCLIALLLIGLAPVAWVFSQSTDSVAFMANLHLIFWIVGLSLGSNLLIRSFAGLGSLANARVWIVIFCIVSLQMMTSLRPIIGSSDSFLPHEKKFFLVHWFETMHPRP